MKNLRNYQPADVVRESRVEFLRPTDTPFESAIETLSESDTALESVAEIVAGTCNADAFAIDAATES